MMKHRVILIPLDGRPPCRQFVIDAGRISGIEVLTPPHEYQDYYSQPGDTRAMAAWLQQSLEEQPADAIILSVDQLLYGGLLAAREHPATEARWKPCCSSLNPCTRLTRRSQSTPSVSCRA